MQILSRALGGKTGRANKGWDIGVTCVHPLQHSQLLTTLGIPSHLPVIECHRDEVIGRTEVGLSYRTTTHVSKLSYRYCDVLYILHRCGSCRHWRRWLPSRTGPESRCSGTGSTLWGSKGIPSTPRTFCWTSSIDSSNVTSSRWHIFSRDFNNFFKKQNC